MAELTFKSAGVSTREIDLSGPTAVRPQGIPAGIIGTSQKGPAFVPITVATYQDFVAEFGGTDGKKFGPLAMNEWMKNARAGLFVRVLGVGNAQKRGDDGEVTNAGFIVGDKLPQDVDVHDGGLLGDNPHAANAADPFDADGDGAADDNQVLGRTYFLGALTREDYDTSGEAAASASLILDPTVFQPANFQSPTGGEDAKGEAIRFADSTGATATIWLHEGGGNLRSFGSSSDDLAGYEDDQNLFVSVGARGRAVLHVDDQLMDGTWLELTDVGDNKMIAQFGDFGGGNSNATQIDLNGTASTADIAAQIAIAIAASALEVDTEVDVNEITITMQQFGNPADEPDGGAFLGNHLRMRDVADTVGAPRTDVSAWNGASYTAAELAARVVSAVGAAATPLAADLVFSSDEGTLTVTQGTVGTDGNADNNGSVSHDWIRDETTISLSGKVAGVDINDSDTFTIDDVSGDNTLTIEFATVAGAGQVSCAVDVAATATIETAGIGASLLPADQIIVSSTAGERLTVNCVAGAAVPDVATVDSAVDPYVVSLNINNTGGAGVVADLVTALNASAIAITASADSDNVNLEQDIAGALDPGTEAVTTIFSDVNDFSPNGSVEFEGGVDVATAEEMAISIHALIEASALDVVATISGEDILIEQMQAGAVDVQPSAYAGVTTTNDVVGADGVELGAGGTPLRGVLVDGADVQNATNFAGGGDPVDGDPRSWDLRDAGVNTQNAAVPLIRAVMMTPRGVRPALVAHADDHVDNVAVNDQAPAACANNTDTFGVLGIDDAGLDPNRGAQVGMVNLSGTQERFVLMLNGHTDSPEFPNVITASFDPQAPDYFMNVLNHDAACTEKAGHYIYSHYNVFQTHATVNVSGHDSVPEADVNGRRPAAFLLRGQEAGGSHADVAANTTHPNYEQFQDRFRTARSPWVMSQTYGAAPKNLFRLHALDDGLAGSGKFKISIANVMMTSGGYGTFDLFVRSISDTDAQPVAYEKFIGLDLNPRSERYIARVIGDLHTYYDFDKRQGSQKLTIDGIHPNRSKYIRVQMDPEVDAGTVPVDALPLGYRGYYHLRTDVSPSDAGIVADPSLAFLENVNVISIPLGSAGAGAGVSPLQAAKVPPVPMRRTIAKGVHPKLRPDSTLFWGTQFQVNDDRAEPNKNIKFNDSILSYGKYFPMYHSSSVNPWVGDNEGAELAHGAVVDADLFNNNSFSLERIQIITKMPSVVSSQNPNVSGKIDHKQWAMAEYRRDQSLSATISTLEQTQVFDGDINTPHPDVPVDEGGDPTISSRFLDPQTDMIDSSTRRFMKFSFFMQGGFDGTSIFNLEKKNLSDLSSAWEMRDVNQGGVAGSTVSGFRKAIDVMAEKADVDIKLLAIPGMRDEAISDYAIDAVEDRFDAMYIMDVNEKSVSNENMIDYSTQKPSVNLTVEDFANRNLDSSFAAAYFPDVVITDPALQTNVQCPPSVAVLGAFSLNDSVAHPWFAPAGFTRGALKSVLETQVKLSRKNLDTLYESDINPLAAFPHTPGVVVWGQKTLQQAQSALDRVNVRRLLIEIRREVRRVGNTLLFEPNREETLGRFSAAVNPILQRIQQQQGLDKFKVVIDTTTTTQADVENNTVRGKIFLQPTRTVEFISLDFVVTNAGMEV